MFLIEPLGFFNFSCFHFLSFLFLVVFTSSRFHFFMSSFLKMFSLLFAFFYFTVSSLLLLLLRALRIGENVFNSSVFFTLHSFPTYGTTCLYEGLPRAESSALNVAGLSTEVRNTDLVHLLF